MSTSLAARETPRRRKGPHGEFSIGGELWPGISKLVEEAGEIIDVLSKPTPERLIEEFGDFDAASEFVAARNNLDGAAISDFTAETLEWMLGEQLLPETNMLSALGQVVQVCGKIIGNEGRHNHWDGSNLPSRLTHCLGRARAAMLYYARYRRLDTKAIAERAAVKTLLFNNWHRETLSKRRGA